MNELIAVMQQFLSECNVTATKACQLGHKYVSVTHQHIVSGLLISGWKFSGMKRLQ
jgi:hypothetical protein